MFENRLKELSRKIGEESKKEFLILTHKKHRREIYFENKKETIKFLKSKIYFSIGKLSKLKKFAYLLLKLGILKPFLKKARLSHKFGEVIFVAEQIKGFDLHKKELISFPRDNSRRISFLKSKKFQLEISKKGFAPRITKLNKKVPFSVEEIFKDYFGNKNLKVFSKLMNFYKSEGIKKVPLKKYINSLKRKIKNPEIMRRLDEISLEKAKSKVLVTKIHGDFAKENTLVDKNGEIFFIDWHPREGLIIEDLVHFFRGEKNPLNNKEFVEILKEVYPKEVYENINLYLRLLKISKHLKLKHNKK